MSFQLKVNGFGLPANSGSRRRHIEIREDPGDEFTWRTVTPQPSPAPPHPPPPTPRFPFLVVLFTCYHSLWLQEKHILSRTKKFG